MSGIALSSIAGTTITLYALMTPPAVLSAFLGNTKNLTQQEKNRIALKTSLAIFIIGILLYIWGARLFELFGFTLDAFRIGAGTLLFLNGLALMRDGENKPENEIRGDISIVPLAVPLGLGPASIGAIMVMGASTVDTRINGMISLFLAAFFMYLLLRLANGVAKILKSTGIAILARLTGLLMAAIAAQVVFTGIKGFLS